MPGESNETALVTGATGAIGPTLVHTLPRFGYSVRTLSRHQPEAGIFPEGVDVRLGDIMDAAAVESAMQQVAVVFDLAALLHMVDPPASMRGDYERINVKGTEIVVDAARRAGVNRVVFFSTIAVYGRNRGEILTEE